MVNHGTYEWTEGRVLYLRLHWGKVTMARMLAALGCSESTIQRKARELKLPRRGSSFTSQR
jgi:hypothetical protein